MKHYENSQKGSEATAMGHLAPQTSTAGKPEKPIHRIAMDTYRHDYKNPIAIVLGSLATLYQMDPGVQKLSHFDEGAKVARALTKQVKRGSWRKASRNARRLLKVADDVHQIYHDESGTPYTDDRGEYAKLAAMTKRGAEFLHNLLGRKEVQLGFLTRQLFKHVETDPRLRGTKLELYGTEALDQYYSRGRSVAQVLLNYLKNAALHGGGRVDVGLIEHASHYELSVSNPGKLAENAKLFERGYRDKTKGGTGLGLSIAQYEARSIGGEVYAKSGEGTVTFSVRLPKSKISKCA